MEISLQSISAGAMTAAVSLGSTLQAASATAAQALPAVAANGAQTVSSVAAAGGGQVVNAGAATTAKLATDLAVVEKPAKALAGAAPKASMITRVAGVVAKALPVVTIGASALSGAQIVQRDGADALVNTKEGRGAVLGALGGALMLVPNPVTQIGAAAVLGAVAVNYFGGMDRLDDARLGAAGVEQSSG